MKSAAAALLTLARDPRYVGDGSAVSPSSIPGLAPCCTILTSICWSPPAGSPRTAPRGSPRNTGDYLVPVKALSQIFRAKICAALHHAGLLDQVPPGIWSTPWVVHCQHAGRGQKVLDYLGRYIFRVAIANSSLERIQDGQVTFRYRDNRPNTPPGHAVCQWRFSSASSSMCCRAAA